MVAVVGHLPTSSGDDPARWLNDHFRYGDLAAALYAAGLPVQPLGLDDIRALAITGVQSAGGIAAIRARADAWRDLALAFQHGQISRTQYTARMSQMWGDAALLERCIAADYARLR
ncbi:hypothetical protein ACFFMN_22945 [Planobispora siamensis]|uniref:Uncharacterized protein n=1 Tax=Planobispora siamensis TaxID=936338 RepID=A0A8J3SMZ8_9ACTN|nr:hypothetical protein [Planobispora siamensis]GIH95425.1 hypothetical protein Psi01_60550 [Planobispora siamensis]